MKKKIIVLFIILAGILAIGSQINASEIQSSFTYQKTNPLYANENISIKADKKLKTSKKAPVKNSSPSISDYIENKDKLALMIQDNMINRNETFIIYAKLVSKNQITQASFDSYIAELIEKAVSEELAQNSSAGDYLKWSWNWYGTAAYSPLPVVKEGANYTYYLNIGFSFIYYTTKAQEDELNSSISNYIDENITGRDYPDFIKIAGIYYYICSNVTYDYDNLNDSSYKLKYTAYAAMQNHTAVCQGYAALYYKMLKEAGCPNIRMITSETHAWNIVKLGNLYYNVDSTWDSEVDTPILFLRGSKVFNSLDAHTRRAEYCTDAFRKKYPTDPEDYKETRDIVDISNGCYIEKLSATYAYTGKAITPTIELAYGDDWLLTLNKDYTVTYKNNTKVGTATIEVKGIGDFTGSITKTYQIVPAQPKNVKISNNTTSQVKLSWTKQPEATGYEVYQYNTKTKKYQKIQTVKGTSCYVKKLAAGTQYTFKVRAYNGKLYGGYTSITSATLPSKVTISSVKAGNKSLTAKWKKITASTGYSIEYSTSKKFTKSTTKTVTITNNKTVSRVIKSLKKKKKYYVRIRAYTKVGSKKYYGTYSAIKSVKTK